MTDSQGPKKPPVGASTAIANTTPNGTLTRSGSGLKLPGLHARLRNPQTQVGPDPLKVSNRLALMLDVSGSMGGKKIESLRDAVSGFVTACDMSDTSIAYEPFGDSYPSPNRVSLTVVQPMLMTTAMMLSAHSNTPMARAMNYVLHEVPLSRGVLVSDGEPDSETDAIASACDFREAGVPVDCVHIGDSTGGEACLKKIAEITGGQYIKFTDVAQFSKSFKYLTPKYYAMLTSGGLSASDLGAKELK